MKRIAIGLVLLMAVAAVPAFSIGIGGAFGLDIAGTVGPGAMLSFHLDTYPAVFGLGFSVGDGDLRVGATADWWLYHTELVSILALYLGPGIWVDLELGDSASVGLGLRVPIGLQAWIIDPLELFLEIAPIAGFKNGKFPAFGVQGAFGFRFWF